MGIFIVILFYILLVSFVRKYEVYVGYFLWNFNWKFSYGYKMKKNGISGVM